MRKPLAIGTGVGASTDLNGQFSLAIPNDSIKLEVSYLGYNTQLIELGSARQIDIILSKSSQIFDEVVVIGYGTRNRRKVTSSIASIGNDAFKNISVPDFQNALQGRLPGVVFSNSSGAANSESSIRVRGVSSIGAGNQPIVVVDGLILSGRINAPNQGNLSGMNTNFFITLNPNDFESVEVLKDAAAAAIYGARGSNGVILITTKKGSFNSSPKVNLGYYAGFQEASKTYDLLDGVEFVTEWNKAARNVGLDEGSGLIYNVADQPSSDWLDLTLRKGFIQETNASVSGGAPSTRYYLGGTFREEQGYLKNYNLKRYSFRTNIDQLIRDKATVGIGINPSRVENSRPGSSNSPFYESLYWYPNLAAFDENGKALNGLLCTNLEEPQCVPGSPLGNLINTNSTINYSMLLFNSYFKYAFTPNFQMKTDFATEFTQLDEYFKYGSGTLFDFFLGNNGYGTSFNCQTVNYNWNTVATYSNTFSNSHNLEVSAGLHITKENLTGTFLEGNGFPDDRLIFLGSAATISNHMTSQTINAFMGVHLRGQYDYKQKYLLTLSARYDGSSRFGVDKRYGFFPAVSAGWMLSEEAFFKVESIDFLKLRSSFGVSGNAEIGDFGWQGIAQFGQNYNAEPGYTLASIENRALGWEKNEQWDVGLEFSLFNHRIEGVFEYYIKNTKDLLLEVPIPATNGLSVLTQNIGRVRNQGFEFELSADILTGPFKWNVQMNGATLKNEVLQLVDNNGDGVDDDIYTQFRFLFRPGLSIGTFFLVPYAGVDPTNGDALFFDLEGNTLANQTPSANRQIVGKSLPDFTGGFLNTFQYKGFDLSVFFEYKTGFQKYILEGQNINGPFNGSSNYTKNTLDSWTPENTDATIPEARLFETNGQQRTSRNVFDADYLRLKNLTLGYTFPVKSTTIKNLRAFITAQNLFLFTSFPGLDPDTEVYSARQAEQGATLGTMPLARSFTAGFNIEF